MTCAFGATSVTGAAAVVANSAFGVCVGLGCAETCTVAVSVGDGVGVWVGVGVGVGAPGAEPAIESATEPTNAKAFVVRSREGPGTAEVIAPRPRIEPARILKVMVDDWQPLTLKVAPKKPGPLDALTRLKSAT